MKQLSNIQQNLRRIVENYRLFRNEHTNAKDVVHKYILLGRDKEDWELSMQQLTAEFDRDIIENKLCLLEDSIYKICRSFSKAKFDKNMFTYANDEFVKSLGLDYSVDENARKTGNFYTFYIDNKKIFTRFEAYPGHMPDIYLRGAY